MYQQKWKSDKALYDAPREGDKKTLDYYKTYVKEFLDSDPLRDWESITRCIKLWEFFVDLPDIKLPKKCSILDCGTKDGQFPEYLVNEGYDEVLGIEISEPYVKYAQKRGRPVEYGDVCNLELITDRSYNVAFAHHLLGLVPDYSTAYAEMIRVIKAGGYVVTLDNIPGNPRKHYQIVESKERLMEIIQNAMSQFEEVIEIVYFDRFPLRDEHGDEFLVILQRTRRKKK